MSSKRRTLKTKIVLEVLENNATINEIVSKYNVSLKSIQQWKEQFLGDTCLAGLVEQEDFNNTIEEFRKIQDVRISLWNKARNLLLKGYETEAYILILATWNFAGFRYFFDKLDLNKFEGVIKTVNPIFKKLENKTFKETNFKNECLQKDIKQIYEEFKGIVKKTGASKIMALKNPDLFVMWDTEIREMYKINNEATSEDYINFLRMMKRKFKKIEYQNEEIPFAKAIDEYNYIKADEIRKEKKKKMSSKAK